MKLTIQKDSFTAGLQQVLNVVGNKPSMPILAHVLLDAHADQTLTLTSTNLDISLKCHIKSDILESGRLTLPAKKLATIVRAMPQSALTVDCTPSHQSKITAGSSSFKLMGLAADEFPAFAQVHLDEEVVLPAEHLQRMLRYVAYAQSTDENRYILNGVYFNFEPDQLVLVATDGRRLALTSEKIQTHVKDNRGVIIPAKTVSELTRLLSYADAVKMSFNTRQVSFEFILNEEAQKVGLVGSIAMVSKIVEGQFPNYKQVIPSETARRIKVERELLLGCIERASLLANDRHSAVKIHLKENILEVTSSSPEIGECHESIAIAYDGPTIQIAFNPYFLMDPLKALTHDEVAFEFKDDLSPGLFKTNDSFLCVVMPLRTQ